MFKRIVCIHGIGGLERETYFHHLKSFCESLGLEVFMPSLGGYKNGISYEDWADYFDKNLAQKLDEQTIVLAQSVGTLFFVKYLSAKRLNVGFYISCCGPAEIEKQDKSNKLRYETSLLFKPKEADFAFFKNLNFPKHSFFCDNDTFFDLENLENYAEKIGGTKHLVLGKAHFNFDGSEAGVEELETFIKSLTIK